MRRWTAVLIGATVLTPASVIAVAQQIQQGGHALDSNLRLGSGGYNSAGAGARYTSAYERRAYRVRGGTSPDYYNAFLAERRYDPSRTMSSYGYVRQPYVQAGDAPVADDAAVEKYARAYQAGYEAGQVDAGPAETPETAAHQMELISYGVGFFLGEAVRAALERDGVDADIEAIIRGFRDGLMDNVPQVSRERLDEILTVVHDQVQGRMIEKLMADDPELSRLAEENRTRSRAFHDAYGRREGVVTLGSGIQYRVLAAGDGRSPGPNDTVIVNYRVMLLDGTVINEGRGTELPVSDATEGGRQIIQMMQEGDHWEVALPPELSHGSAGQAPHVGPNETVFGSVELVEIK